MRARTILVIIIFLVSIFFITSCGKKPECITNSDCATGNPCITAKCTEGACVKRVLDGCCGNSKCESDENSCTCDKDCGKCEGKYKYNVSYFGKQKAIETALITQYCENDKCVKGVLPDKINSIKLVNDVLQAGAFKVELLTTLNNPFIIGKDTVSIRMFLKDRDPFLVNNITFTRIQVLEGSEVLGEKMINKQLARVGEIWTDELELVSAQSVPEESKSIDIKLDYGFTVLEKVGREPKTLEYIYNRTSRLSTTKGRLAEKIMVIKLPN